MAYDDINIINTIAIEAGKQILSIYQQENFEIQLKSDQSPLTKADQHSHKYIAEKLSNLNANIPILSEENAETISYSTRRHWKKFWLVDPLDGTKEFIKRNDQFTVNIALIENGKPILGVVYAPALSTLYYAAQGNGAYKKIQAHTERLPLKKNTTDTLRVLNSSSHLNAETTNYINTLLSKGQEIETISMGSSLKFCLLAEGSADIYPRLAPTMEWDTAAAHMILQEAGGQIYEYQTEQPLTYNKENLRNPFFIAKIQ